MDYISLFLLALGLSLDDFALAFALSSILPNPTKKTRLIHASKMALAFSISTGILPLLGWLISMAIYNWIVSFSAWVLLIVFCGVGGWIIKEAFEEETDKWKEKKISSFWVLLVLGILGSLDECAVGFGFPFLDIPVVWIIVWVLLLNTILVYLAAFISSWNAKLNKKIPTVGSGIIMICLGIINWFELAF